MNVLLVNTFHYLRGGDCRYTFALAELLRTRGHEVHHFAMRHPRNLPCADDRWFVEHVDFPAELARASLPAAARVLKRAIHSTQAKERFAAMLRELRPELVHLQNIHGHITPSILDATDGAGVPVVWTLHDYRLVCPNTHLLSHGKICEACAGGRFLQCTLKRCKKNSAAASAVATLEAHVHRLQRVSSRVDRFLSPSRFLARKFEEMGWKGRPPEYLPLFIPPAGNGGETRRPGGYGLYMGQLAAHKGLATLLRAAALTPDLPLRIAGEGPEREQLERQAAGLRNVRFEGHLTGEALRNLLDAALFVAVPSEWYENSPYAVLEAMGAAKPVIASNLGGLPDLVTHGETGLLFPPGDATALAGCMEQLRRDPDQSAAMGRAALARARNNHSADAHYASLMKVYAEAREQRQSTARQH